MHLRYQFVSRIAAGDTEKKGPAGQRGSLFKGPDAVGRPAGLVPLGWGGGRHQAASGSCRVEPAQLTSPSLPATARRSQRGLGEFEDML